jgi:hypothetical protein
MLAIERQKHIEQRIYDNPEVCIDEITSEISISRRKTRHVQEWLKAHPKLFPDGIRERVENCQINEKHVDCLMEQDGTLFFIL